MAKFNKCFERFEGGYREFPYSLLFVDGKRNPEYAGRYFLPLNGFLMEVAHQDYVDFYKDIRHRKYIREESSLHGEISYSSIGDDELNGEELIRDVNTDVEDEAITSVTILKLREALLQLPEKEQKLIDELYFHGKSEMDIFRETGVLQQTISYRQKKI